MAASRLVGVGDPPGTATLVRRRVRPGRRRTCYGTVACLRRARRRGARRAATSPRSTTWPASLGATRSARRCSQRRAHDAARRSQRIASQLHQLIAASIAIAGLRARPTCSTRWRRGRAASSTPTRPSSRSHAGPGRAAAGRRRDRGGRRRGRPSTATSRRCPTHARGRSPPTSATATGWWRRCSFDAASRAATSPIRRVGVRLQRRRRRGRVAARADGVLRARRDRAAPRRSCAARSASASSSTPPRSGSWRPTSRGAIQWWNRAAATLFGWPEVDDRDAGTPSLPVRRSSRCASLWAAAAAGEHGHRARPLRGRARGPAARAGRVGRAGAAVTRTGGEPAHGRRGRDGPPPADGGAAPRPAHGRHRPALEQRRARLQQPAHADRRLRRAPRPRGRRQRALHPARARHPDHDDEGLDAHREALDDGPHEAAGARSSSRPSRRSAELVRGPRSDPRRGRRAGAHARCRDRARSAPTRTSSSRWS